MLGRLAEVLSRADVRRVDGVTVLRYAPASVVAWCGIVALALALAPLCWLAAQRVARRYPAATGAIVRWKILSGMAAVFSLGMTVLALPGVIRSEVRISDASLTQSTGIWSTRVREFRLNDISVIFRTTEPGEFETRTVWSIRRRGGTSERFEPGDLISHNAELVAAELMARNVVVIPASSQPARRE